MPPLVQIGLPQAASPKKQTVPSEQATRNIVVLQVVTLAWMLVECGVSLRAAKTAHSPALLAFGSDSFVELLSAAIVLLQFLPSFPVGKRNASRIAGVLLLVIAAMVALIAILALKRAVDPDTSVAGLSITVAAMIAMPILACKKRAAARATNNRALAADAVQSATCAYLAAVTLIGLAVNALYHVSWVDSGASLVAVPIIIFEGGQALRGESCGCC